MICSRTKNVVVAEEMFLYSNTICSEKFSTKMFLAWYLVLCEAEPFQTGNMHSDLLCHICAG